MTYTNVNSIYLSSFSPGTLDGHTIFGGSGSKTIYGDAFALHGSVTAYSNTIWAYAPGAGYSSDVNTIYGNGYFMDGDTTGGANFYGQIVGNHIYDTCGATSYLYGNAYSMTDHAWGGHNTITALSTTSWVYGDAYQINGSTTSDAWRAAGVSAGHNSITFDSAGCVYGDAYSIQGTFYGGHNNILIGSQQSATVYGTAYTLDGGDIACGGNVIQGGSSANDMIYGDAFQNYASAVGSGNIIYAGSGGGNAYIYGSCGVNYGTFTATGGNTIDASHGSGNLSIFGNCATNDGTFTGGHNTIFAGTSTDFIYGDCLDTSGRPGTFQGGYNTIYAGTGNVHMFGSAADGHNTFVFAPGTGVDYIGAGDIFNSINHTPAFQGFDQEGGTTFNHAKGDVIDLTAYHFRDIPLITDNDQLEAVIHLEPGSWGNHPGQVTLAGVHSWDLTASDFRI